MQRVRQLAPMVGRQRPSTVEYWYWDGSEEVAEAIIHWVNQHKKHTADLHPHEPMILIDEKAPPGFSVDALRPGCWLVKDRFGDFFPLPDDVFRGTYESLL